MTSPTEITMNQLPLTQGNKRWPYYLGKPDRHIENYYKYQAQSILTMDGKVGPLLSVRLAKAVIRWAALYKGKVQ